MRQRLSVASVTARKILSRVPLLVVLAFAFQASVSGIVHFSNRQAEQAFATNELRNTLQGRLATLNQQSSSDSVAPPQFAPSPGLCSDCARSDEADSTITSARLDPRNRTGASAGIDLLSQNFHWSTALLGADGRAQLGVNLTLSYNSLVWTRADGQLMFDADRGHPAPGFRLGFPTIQGRYRSDDGSWYYLLIAESGARIPLRQTSTPTVYESTDSSLFELVDHGSQGAVLRRSTGNILTFAWHGGQLQCTELKDRNGNYLSIAYDDYGHLRQVIDTVGRIFTFERDGGGTLISIVRTTDDTQVVMATFGYDDLAVSVPTALLLRGVESGSRVKVLTRVGLKDGSSYGFIYSPTGQVWRIDKLAPDGHLLTYSSLNLPLDPTAIVDDAPRPSEIRTWVADADAPDATVVHVDGAPDHRWGRVTRSDGSTVTEFFETAELHGGLTLRIERRDAAGALTLTERSTWRDVYRGDRFLRTVRATHDVIWPPSSNAQDTRTTYDDLGMRAETINLKGGVVTGRTQVTYNRSAAYVEAHILHLRATVVTSGNAEQTTTSFEYDKPGRLVDQGIVVQHDRNYGSSRLVRGLVSTIRRRIGARSFEQSRTYNATGTLAQLSDSDGRSFGLDYTDVFTDGRPRNAWAFATTSWTSVGVSTHVYDLETGTAAQTTANDGTVTETRRDRAGRIVETANWRTGEVRRRVYSPTADAVALFVKRPRWQGENAFYTYFDGAGRSRASLRGVTNRPNEFTGRRTVRDAIGRPLGAARRLDLRPAEAAGSSLSLLQSSWNRLQLVGTAIGQVVAPTLSAENCYYYYPDPYDTEYYEWYCEPDSDPWADYDPWYESNSDFLRSLNSGDPDYDDPYYQSLQAEAYFYHWAVGPVYPTFDLVVTRASEESRSDISLYSGLHPYLDEIIAQLSNAGIVGLSGISWDGGGFHAILTPQAIQFLQSMSHYADPDAAFTTGATAGHHSDICGLPGGCVSYRSYNGTYGSGSLQLVVNSESGAAHIDVDHHNPNQDLFSFLGHLVLEVLPGFFQLCDYC